MLVWACAGKLMKYKQISVWLLDEINVIDVCQLKLDGRTNGRMVELSSNAGRPRLTDQISNRESQTTVLNCVPQQGARFWLTWGGNHLWVQNSLDQALSSRTFRLVHYLTRHNMSIQPLSNVGVLMAVLSKQTSLSVWSLLRPKKRGPVVSLSLD